MRGTADSSGRALVTVALRSDHRSPAVQLEVWIDTGFTGDLVIPQSKIVALGLSQSGSVDAVLADGSQTELNKFSCTINWFGSERNLEVIANDGAYPLLGVGLLLGLELRIDYQKFVLTLAPPVRP